MSRWRRGACGFWLSGNRDCGLERDRQARGPFSPMPEEARVALTAVESIIQVCKSIKPCSFNFRCSSLEHLIECPLVSPAPKPLIHR